MTSLLERRLFVGVAALALLALAGTATTVVSQRASAGGNNETCATQEAGDGEGHAEAEGSESETEDANDTDNVELECGD